MGRSAAATSGRSAERQKSKSKLHLVQWGEDTQPPAAMGCPFSRAALEDGASCLRSYARSARRAAARPALATRDGCAHLYLLAATDALHHAK